MSFVLNLNYCQFFLSWNWKTALDALHITKKYWRSAGNSKNFSSRIHKRSRCFFRLTKLHKKTIWKAAAKENFTNSMQNSSPHFANIMLHEAPFHCFYSNFSSFFRWNSIFQASNSQIFNKIYFSVIFNKISVNIFDFSGEF